MSVPLVTNIRQLTTDDVGEILALLKKDPTTPRDKYNEFDIIIACDNTQDDLIRQDYVIGDVIIDDVSYKFIHGFPGDEPCGVVYTADLTIVSSVHWSMDKGIDAICDWYLKSVNQYNEPQDDDDSEFEMTIPTTWFA